MLVLGIETSCDETALSVCRFEKEKFQVLGEEIASQTDLHSRYGGVVPELASREHLRNLPLLYADVLRQSSISLDQIDLIAVTSGPGLKGCLLTGIAFAEGLAIGSGKAVAAVNHIEGHLFAGCIENSKLKPPFLALIVSGGHTEIVLVNALGDYRIIARTIDDAAGECFDKSANLLGLPYPGGPNLANLADRIAKDEALSFGFKLPRVMLNSSDFSFSGLKTAIALLIRKSSQSITANVRAKAALAFCIQEAIVYALATKILDAVKLTGITQVVVSGGVAANRRLRERLGEEKGISVVFPSPIYCTDNAVMIALVGAMRAAQGQALCAMEVQSRWPVEELNSAVNPGAQQ